MAQKTLLPFGASSVATVHPSGIIDLRVVDDHTHRTLTSRMQVDELARIAKIVFTNVHNDPGYTKRERDLADDVDGKIMSFLQKGV